MKRAGKALLRTGSAADAPHGTTGTIVLPAGRDPARRPAYPVERLRDLTGHHVITATTA